MLVQLLLPFAISCERDHLGGIDGLSKVQGDDAAGAVFGFLSGLLRMEMPQLRRHHRPHHFE